LRKKNRMANETPPIGTMYVSIFKVNRTLQGIKTYG
jgi:hypothetical protein